MPDQRIGHRVRTKRPREQKASPAAMSAMLDPCGYSGWPLHPEANRAGTLVLMIG